MRFNIVDSIHMIAAFLMRTKVFRFGDRLTKLAYIVSNFTASYPPLKINVERGKMYMCLGSLVIGVLDLGWCGKLQASSFV